MDIIDGYIEEPPRDQTAIDLFAGSWSGRFPSFTGITAGEMSLIDDSRIKWLADNVNLRGLSVLELGPLEAAHTYMMLNSGAASVLAIEASKKAYLKCLVVKEILSLANASFKLGNFIPFLQETEKRWSLIVACGVLYHVPDPVSVLQTLADRSDQVFIWTHYADDKAMPVGDPRRTPLQSTESVEWRGRELTLHRRSYLNAIETPTFCGGVYDAPAWMQKQDIMDVLADCGLTNQKISFDDPKHQNGPAFCLLAQR